MTNEEHIRALIQDLADPDNDTQIRAESELVDIGSPAVELVMEATKHANPQVRWRAAWTLGHIGDARGYPAVLALLSDTDFDVRADGADAAAELGGTDAIGPLAEVVRQADEHPHGAIHAASALACMGSVAVPALVQIVQTGNSAAKAQAINELGSMNAMG